MPAASNPTKVNASDERSHVFFLGWPLSNGGGVAEVVRNLIRESLRDGRLHPVLAESMERTAPGTESQPSLPVVRLPLPTPYSAQHPLRALLSFLAKLPLAFWRLRRLCQDYRVQVLNPHFVGLEAATLSAFRHVGLFRGELIFSFHGADARSLIQARGWERTLARWTLRRADVLIPCSDGLAEELLMLVPELAERIRPIQNGIDANDFVASARPYDQLPPNFRTRRRLLNVAAFEYKKGHDVLLKAFARLRKSRNDVCLIIAGAVRERLGEAQRLVAELGLTEDVLLLQNLPHGQVAGLLQACDVFVLSSRWEKGICGEGFALALLEAGAMAKPVVSTRSCGVTELIEAGKSGVLVPPENPEALSSALEFMLDHPAEAVQLAHNLQRRVCQQFTWKNAYQRYLGIAGISGQPSAATADCAGLVCSRD